MRLAWLDELEALSETISTQTELARSAVRLQALVNLAETSAEALETALTRAESLAAIRYGYEVPTVAVTPRPARTARLQQTPQVPASVRSSLAPATPGAFSHAKAKSFRARHQTPLAEVTNSSTPRSRRKSAGRPSTTAGSVTTPMSAQRGRANNNLVKRRYAAPSPALSDPPTPNMEDLGLSAAALNVLKRM